jgi:hypothetical protein
MITGPEGFSEDIASANFIQLIGIFSISGSCPVSLRRRSAGNRSLPLGTVRDSRPTG